ncbi:MAG: sporulation protein YabP [Clostridia bacterium]|nr:sporulation protein YabP [Clostridia bacterium]
MSDNETIYTQSNVYIENREKLRITGVKDVDSFDEESICVQTQKGDIVLNGEQLKIAKLDVESGELSVEGVVHSLFYKENAPAKNISLFGRLMK